MKRDRLRIIEIDKLIKDKRGVIKYTPISNSFKNLVIDSAILNVELPCIYVEEDKYGVLYFNDTITSSLISFLNSSDFPKLDPCDQTMVEDYELKLVIKKSNVSDEKEKLFNELKNKFNFIGEEKERS
jgi:hypothetical protein